MTGELKMVYILKNLNLRKLCISFTICFIFIIIGITHVFADEKPTITQVVMDKDVGARLNELESVKMSVKAEGATEVHAWITNKNSYHYNFDNPDERKKYSHYVKFEYNNATREYEYTFVNDEDAASGKWVIEKFVLSDNAGKSYDCYFIQNNGTYKDLEDFYVNVYKGGMIDDLVFVHFQEWNPISGEYENKTTKSVQRGTAAEDLGRLYKPADIDGLNFIKWHGEDGQKMNDDQFNYAYPEYDKKIVRLYTSDENGTEKLLDVKYSMQNDEIDLSEYNNNLKNYDLKWYYFGSEFNVLRNPVEINDMYTVNEYASQILVAALTPKNEEPGQPNTPETPQTPEESNTTGQNISGRPNENSVKEETNNTVENQSVNEEIQAEDTLSPKTGESQLGKTMAAMVIVGCMASVIYIVRKRELYEK